MIYQSVRSGSIADEKQQAAENLEHSSEEICAATRQLGLDRVGKTIAPRWETEGSHRGARRGDERTAYAGTTSAIGVTAAWSSSPVRIR